MSRLLLIISLICSLGCKSTKNLSSVKSINSEFVMPELNSTLNLHFGINKNSVKDSFNEVLDLFLNEDLELSALGMEITLRKAADANMQFAGKKVLSYIPLEITISQNSFLRSLKGNGKLDLNFISELNIDSSWQLITETELEFYEWSESPKLSIGGINISIEKIANSIIEKSKGEFQTQIDKAIADQFNLRSIVMDFMKYAEEPIRVDTLEDSYVEFIPKNVYLSEFMNTEILTRGNLTVQGKTKLLSELPDKVTGLSLPRFSWEKELDDTSHINMIMDISYFQLNQYLNKNFIGKKFGDGDKSILINKLNLSKVSDKISVTADVEGSIDGIIKIEGKPVFDNEKQLFYCEEIDISVKTGNVFHKAASWLFKRKIKNDLKSLLRFSVKENLTQFQDQLDAQIKTYNSDNRISLSSKINTIHIDEFILDVNQIHAFVTFNIYMESIIHDIKAFNPKL